MSLGRSEQQKDLLDDVSWFCEETLAPSSVFAVLHRERHRMFPDEMFADLFSNLARLAVLGIHWTTLGWKAETA